MAAVQTTTLNRSWILKMGIFLVALAGFGVWSLIDGLVIFPRRGELDASYKLYQYLEAARDAGRLTRDSVLVSDPRREMEELGQREADLRRAVHGTAVLTGTSKPVAVMNLARLEWLRSLQRVWRLDSAPSRIEEDVSTQLSNLAAQWKVNQPPKPLNAMDLAFQYVFMVGGFGGALWILAVVMRARGTRFTWDPQEQRLTLPDGTSIVPADIAEFDKRKWHKYYVTLVMKDGRTRTLDLLRYVPLEEWVLTMEKTVHPEAGAGDGGEGGDNGGEGGGDGASGDDGAREAAEPSAETAASEAANR